MNEGLEVAFQLQNIFIKKVFYMFTVSKFNMENHTSNVHAMNRFYDNGKVFTLRETWMIV